MRSLLRLIAVLAATAYVLNPLDFDFIPIIGWIDDLIVIVLTYWFIREYLPQLPRPEPQTSPGPQSSTTDPADDRTFDARFESANPYEVLGVPRSAASVEIKTAYRDLLAAYHPDKVSHLSPEFQALAHKRAVAIRQAYDRVAGA